MEALYYSVPMELALKKVYRLLKKQGIFYCGTDFYKDNTLTTRWTKDMYVGNNAIQVVSFQIKKRVPIPHFRDLKKKSESKSSVVYASREIEKVEQLEDFYFSRQ